MLGVSPDPVAKVKKFHEKQGLNFSLLADEGHHLADAYGVWAEKSMYGKTYFGNERTTFVIGPDGVVATVLRKVKPGEHDERVLEALAKPPRRSSSRPQPAHRPGARQLCGLEPGR